MTSEQVMKIGDKLLDSEQKFLENMVKTINKGRDMMKDTNKELQR